MYYWVELGLLVLTAGGVVQGYLGGLRKTLLLTLALLLAIAAASVFARAGADYLIAYHQADVKMIPVLMQRLPLVVTVTPHQAFMPEVGQRAAAMVHNMPITPVYRDWLAGLPPFQVPGSLTEHGLIAQVFAALLLRKGVFLFFFGTLLLGVKLMGNLAGQRQEPSMGRPGRLMAALLGGGFAVLSLAVILTALTPFSPLFFGFLAFDLARSPLVGYLTSLGLLLLSGY